MGTLAIQQNSKCRHQNILQSLSYQLNFGIGLDIFGQKYLPTSLALLVDTSISSYNILNTKSQGLYSPAYFTPIKLLNFNFKRVSSMSKKHGHIFPVYHHIFFVSPLFFLSFLAATAIKNEGICSGKICVPKGEHHDALK